MPTGQSCEKRSRREVVAEAGRMYSVMSRPRNVMITVIVFNVALVACAQASEILVAPSAAWTWFNDERAIIVGNILYAGYVRAEGKIAVSRLGLDDGLRTEVILSTEWTVQADDHNNPSLTLLPDGRILALYSLHDSWAAFHKRVSRVPFPAVQEHWEGEVSIPTNHSTTYSNTYMLSAENNTLFNFYRAVNWNPTLSLSRDLGDTWQQPIHFIQSGSGYVRPYPRFSSNGVDRIDVIYTEGHPRHVNNSIYHMYYQKGTFYHTNGTKIKHLTELPLLHDRGERGTLVYQYQDHDSGPQQDLDEWIPSGNAWTWDVHLDQLGYPVCVFSVKLTRAALNWKEDRIYYYYARWTGTRWVKRLIASAGRPLYDFEDSYAGGIALDPTDPSIVYLSSNAELPFRFDSVHNVPLNKDERYEIWKGTTADGASFTWAPVTQNSTGDNLRPHVTAAGSQRRVLLWFRGVYDHYVSYKTELVARVE